MSAILPRPSPDAIAHSQRLSAHIQAIIAKNGPISFANYMDLALYAPGLGYYSAGAQKFGEAGDFITAPELTPLFGQCLAAAFDKVLSTLETPTLFELGAGSGKLARDILQNLHCPIDAYYILEVSADLKAKQQALLKNTCPKQFHKIHWLDSLPDTPINGIIFGNEVLDALPVHCFEKKGDAVYERNVAVHHDHFVWQNAPATAALQKTVSALNLKSSPYQSEINSLLPAWLASLNDSLKQGMLLFIDYGFSEREYYHPDRNTGTLICHYRHHTNTDPFFYPGLQDITAHVDFTAVAIAADALDLEIAGYCNQANFLLEAGIETLAKTIDIKTSKAIQTLLFPHEMGELFKVIALNKSCPAANELIKQDAQTLL